MFTLKPHPYDKEWFYITPRRNRKIITGFPSAIHGWKNKYFFISWPGCERVRAQWEESLKITRSYELPEQDIGLYGELCLTGITRFSDLLNDGELYDAAMGRVSKETLLRAGLADKRRREESTSEERREVRSKRKNDASPSSSAGVPTAPCEPTPTMIAIALPPARPEVPSPSNRSTTGTGMQGDPKMAKSYLKSAIHPLDKRNLEDKPLDKSFSDAYFSLYQTLINLSSIEKMGSTMEDLKRRSAEGERAVRNIGLELAKSRAEVKEEKGKLALAEIRADRHLSEMLSWKEEAEANQKRVAEQEAEIESLKRRVITAGEEAVTKYKDSEDYVNDLSLECISSYLEGFEECREQVRKKQPEVDVSNFVSDLRVLQPGVQVEKDAEVSPAEASAEAAEPSEVPTAADEQPDFWTHAELEHLNRLHEYFRTIAENTGLFFFAYEIGYGRCIKKVQRYFPEVDSSFLTLTDLDSEEVIQDVMGDDALIFVKTAMEMIDKTGSIAACFDEHDPADLPIAISRMVSAVRRAVSEKHPFPASTSVQASTRASKPRRGRGRGRR